jgi:IS1 family transposase
MRDLPCERIQCDEVWAFCYSKQRNVPEEHQGEWGYGDVWTWTAICADTKLVPSWRIGRRDATEAYHFLTDLRSRLSKRVQLTTDAHRAYLRPVNVVFRDEIDYATLHKLYGAAEAVPGRYSPAQCIGVDGKVITGDPDPEHISTSYAERQNLTMRMGMRRFTRLTNGFSKKVTNLTAAVSIHFAHYNLCRPRQTLTKANAAPTTPAMAAGVTDHVWTLDELVRLLDKAERERAPKKRGPYKKRVKPVSD